MSFLHLAEEADSREKQYGDLGAMLPKLLHGADEIIQGGIHATLQIRRFIDTQ